MIGSRPSRRLTRLSRGCASAMTRGILKLEKASRIRYSRVSHRRERRRSTQGKVSYGERIVQRWRVRRYVAFYSPFFASGRLFSASPLEVFFALRRRWEDERVRGMKG